MVARKGARGWNGGGMGEGGQKAKRKKRYISLFFSKNRFPPKNNLMVYYLDAVQFISSINKESLSVAKLFNYYILSLNTNL